MVVSCPEYSRTMISARFTRCTRPASRQACLAVCPVKLETATLLQVRFCRAQHSSQTTGSTPTNDRLNADRNSNSSSNNNKLLQLKPNLVDSFQQNINWFNQHYEKVFGIAEIRHTQTRVLKAEAEFVEVTHQRKVCQDKIEHFRNEIKSIRDKLEMTPRQSDSYLKLITQEHNLLREQLALEAELAGHKEREQLLLDNLSKLLRISHELERLRQERSKYWQIVSIILSITGSLVAIFAQRVRSQKSVINQMVVFEGKFAELEDSLRKMSSEADEHHAFNLVKFDELSVSVREIARRLPATPHNSGGERTQSQAGWISGWVPGWSHLRYWLGYAHS